MQDRHERPHWLADLAVHAVFGTLFPLFRFASRNFARRERAYEISDQVISAFLELAPGMVENVRGNMAQVLGLPPEHPAAAEAAERAIRNHAYAWVDFFFYGQRPPEEALKIFASMEGIDHLDRAAAEGRGAILLTAHAGNYELGGLLLRSRGMELYTVYKPDQYAAVERLRGDMRRQGGVVGIPVDGKGFSTLPLVKVLREGKLVGMQGDRDFSLNGLRLPFFGRETYFPRGPWELAAMTGSPVLPSFFFMDDRHRFHARIFEPIRVEGGRGERMAAIERGMRTYVALLEQLVREHPAQWYCFYPFWDDPLRKALEVP